MGFLVERNNHADSKAVGQDQAKLVLTEKGKGKKTTREKHYNTLVVNNSGGGKIEATRVLPQSWKSNRCVFYQRRLGKPSWKGPWSK